jgi:hypothetical protein
VGHLQGLRNCFQAYAEVGNSSALKTETVMVSPTTLHVTKPMTLKFEEFSSLTTSELA